MRTIIDYIKKLKNDLKNPKKKSITLIIIYFIFFVFVFIVINNGKRASLSNQKVKINEPNDTVEAVKVNSYEYNYIVTNGDKIDEIKGTHYDNSDIFEINKKKYYLENDNIIDMDSNNPTYDVVYNIKLYSYSNIEKLIDISSNKEQTTYKDNSKKTIYSTNIQNIISSLSINQECVNTCDNLDIEYTVYETEYIEKVVIDLSEYYNFNYSLEFTYNNINEIEEIKISTLSE